MLTRDLITYVEFGRALWADPQHSIQASIETWSAVSLLELTEERAVERASAALLDRAVQQGMAVNTLAALENGAFNHFFKLFPEERFLLVALHLGRWSYARAAKVMQRTPEQIEALAWKARVRLAAAKGLNPIGAKLASANCPEYDLDRPWTQRFLDEEYTTGRETIFLQTHLMACDSCRGSLSRCRDVYFAVEELLPRVDEEDGILDYLRRVCRKGRKLRNADEVTFGQSLLAFLRNKDVLLLLTLGVFALLAYLLHR